MTAAYSQLLLSVQTVRRTWQVRRAFEGVLLATAVWAGVLTVASMLDQASAYGVLGRSLLAFVLWACTIPIAFRYIAQPLTAAHTDDFFAALIEQRHPTLANRLINALQLGRDEAPRSPRLVEAIIADGAAAADEIDSGKAVAGPALKHHGIALGAALLVAAVYLVAAGPGARVSMARVLLPVANIAPFTWTNITITQPSDTPVRILEGEPLLVNITATGAGPMDAAVNWLDSRGTRRALRMARGSEKAVEGDRLGRKEVAFAYTFPGIDSNFEFFITAGDARTNPIPVLVEPRPRIAGMSAVLQYPAWTSLPSREIKDFDGHLHGLPQTKASLVIRANKPLTKMTLLIENSEPIYATRGEDDLHWKADLTITETKTYTVRLTDAVGNELNDATRYTITAESKTAPQIGFAKPGRDLQVKPGDAVEFQVIAQDELGLGPARFYARVNTNKDAVLVHEWPNAEAPPLKRKELDLKKTVEELGLKAGDRLEYWATVVDRNNVAPQPGYGESRRYHIIVLTPDAADRRMDAQLMEYAKAITELIRLQRLNRTETEGTLPAGPLIEREATIRRGVLAVAETMQKNAFPMETMITDLRALASDPVAKVITLLESYRDATESATGKKFAADSLPVQDKIIAELEEMLKRLNRNEQVRATLKKLEKTEPIAHKETVQVLAKLSKDLDKFLSETRDLKDQFEKMSKRNTDDDAKGESNEALQNAEHRLDRWKQWAKDSVDGIAKLPEGFVKDSNLSQEMKQIFEEIEKQKRSATTEIVTPMEEGVMAVGTEVKEDLEVWNMAAGDSVKWTMEDPNGGKFEVPPYTLPEKLQDLVGDLIEDMDEFDQEADDNTGTQGGNNAQAGWDIADGPIAGFSAIGKTGNQMPNNSEMGGRSGDGRRGKSTGQSVGDESRAMQGRPTPARVTNEKYEEGQPKAGKQLDPRGSTGGGKKTGSGSRGLQGGTKPDFVKDLERLTEKQQQLKERMQQIARELDGVGKSSSHVNRALDLIDSSAQDLKDQRYDDAARKRKQAIGELKAEQSQIEQGVSLTLQKAQNLPPEMRSQISAGSQQALPEGYEDLVGAYYKAVSGAGEAAPAKTPQQEGSK